jgi:acetyltransferase-like isoleucine patch superfamily enzyme
MLGCRIGKDTFFSGIVLDPHFVSFGSRSVVGLQAIIIPHIIEGDRLAHFRIEVGDDVTIGADSIILAGVKIGSGSIVGAKSLVSKDTIIGNNELWMGTPARFVKLLR